MVAKILCTQLSGNLFDWPGLDDGGVIGHFPFVSKNGPRRRQISLWEGVCDFGGGVHPVGSKTLPAPGRAFLDGLIQGPVSDGRL